MGRLLCLLSVLLVSCTDSRQVTSSTYSAFEPDLAASEELLALAWNDNRTGNDEIYLQLYTPTLQASTEALRLTSTATPSYEASVALFNEDIAVAWYERLPGGNLQAMLGLWDRHGQLRWQQALAGAPLRTRIPVVVAVDKRLFVAWVEDAQSELSPSRLRGAWVSNEGLMKTPLELGPASRTTWNLNAAAVGNDRVMVVFDAVNATRSNELWMARIDESGSSLSRLSADDGYASKYPDIAVQGERTALTWFDMKDGNTEVYLATFNRNGELPSTIETTATRVTRTAGESIGAYLAWSGSTLGLSWCDNTDGQHELYFQHFDAKAKALSPTKQITDTPEESMIPSVKASGNGFVLAWNEVSPGTGDHEDHVQTRKSTVLLQQVD